MKQILPGDVFKKVTFGICSIRKGDIRETTKIHWRLLKFFSRTADSISTNFFQKNILDSRGFFKMKSYFFVPKAEVLEK